jgi:hypothetical protein
MGTIGWKGRDGREISRGRDDISSPVVGADALVLLQEVVHDTLMSSAQQAADHIGTHAAEANHSQLHIELLSRAQPNTPSHALALDAFKNGQLSSITNVHGLVVGRLTSPLKQCHQERSHRANIAQNAKTIWTQSMQAA